MRHLGESEKTKRKRKKKKIRFPIHTITNILPFGEPSHIQGHQSQLPFKGTYGLGHLREGSGAIQIQLTLLVLSQWVSLRCRNNRWASQPLLAIQYSTVARRSEPKALSPSCDSRRFC